MKSYSVYSGIGSCFGSYFLKIRSKMMHAVNAVAENPQIPLTIITRAIVFVDVVKSQIINPKNATKIAVNGRCPIVIYNAFLNICFKVHLK